MNAIKNLVSCKDPILSMIVTVILFGSAGFAAYCFNFEYASIVPLLGLPITFIIWAKGR